MPAKNIVLYACSVQTQNSGSFYPKIQILSWSDMGLRSESIPQDFGSNQTVTQPERDCLPLGYLDIYDDMKILDHIPYGLALENSGFQLFVQNPGTSRQWKQVTLSNICHWEIVTLSNPCQ